MTKLGTKYNYDLVVSCTIRADNTFMTNFQIPQNLQNVPTISTSLRAAYGPGFQLSGPTDAALRAITSQLAR